MPLIRRNELGGKLKDILTENGPRIFLFFGERFLCRKAVDELQEALLKWKNGTVYSIDGDQEDSAQTLSKLMSFSLLPGLQVYRVNDSRLFLSKNISQTVWQKACQAFKAGRNSLAAKYIADLYHSAGLTAEDRMPVSQIDNEQWLQLFGFARPEDTGWTEQIQQLTDQQNVKSSETADLPERYMQSFDKGMAPNSVLILTAENIDKRKRLFSYFKEHGMAVDCSVAEGAGAAAQKVQKSVLLEMMHDTLAEFNMTIESGALEILFERVGFHPVAVVMETEKLALYCSDKQRITLEDVKRMVGRSREDALFELTDHFGKRQLAETLTTLHHLLENGIHGLAILATMRNYTRKLLIFRSLQHRSIPAYHKGMAAKQFQGSYLPQLKEQGEWQDMLKGHPYALFMSFAKAAEFSCQMLKGWLGQILQAEFRLKGSGISERIILEQLIIDMMRGNSPQPRR